MSEQAAGRAAVDAQGQDDRLLAASRRIEDLIQTATSDADRQWAEALQGAVRDLALVFAEHKAESEAADGPLASAETRKPNLKPLIDRERGEHAGLLLEADELEQEIEEQLAFDQLETEIFSVAADVLVRRIRLHMLRFNKITFEAYFQEEGGEQGSG